MGTHACQPVLALAGDAGQEKHPSADALTHAGLCWLVLAMLARRGIDRFSDEHLRIRRTVAAQQLVT